MFYDFNRHGCLQWFLFKCVCHVILRVFCTGIMVLTENEFCLICALNYVYKMY